MADFLGGISSTGFKLGQQLLLALVAIVVLASLFFGTKYFVLWWKRRKNYKISAVIFNPDGTWYTKRIGKFRGPDNIDKMLFQGSNETMPVIDPKYIRSNRVCLWRYGVAQYAVIPPKIWEQMDPKKWGIDVINFQMKNFAFLEQRAAVSRWAYLKDALQRWAPYITIVVLGIIVCVAIWFLMKTSLNMYNQVISARVLDCRIVLGQAPAPGV